MARKRVVAPIPVSKPIPTFTKDLLIQKLREIRDREWIPTARAGNAGGIGNTLEDLLGIVENNLPIPNAAEWELKSQRAGSSSLLTLFHSEPSPRAIRFVPAILLPDYGWRHQKAGKHYPSTEMSFRQTISGLERSDRGFKVVVDRAARKVEISFDAKAVDNKHADWLKDVEKRTGLKELDPQPYWGFNDLSHIAGSKLVNCFYIEADVKHEGRKEFFHYSKILILQNFSLDGLLNGIELGHVYVDFDARTGHNHGTKIRLRRNRFPELYETRIVV